MPSRKVRRRRDKLKRHEYEYVLETEEGDEVVVEPGAAVGLAALLAGKLPPKRDTIVVLSGANIDPELHARIIAEAA